MRTKTAFTKKDIIVILVCVIFLVMNLGVISGGARRRAKETVCLSNLYQWGTVFQMYTNDNNGFFANRNTWPNDLRPYYKDGNLRLCPKAIKPFVQGAQQPFAAWGPLSEGEEAGYWAADWPEPVTSPDNYLSYGANEWVFNFPISDWEISSYLWKTPNVRGADSVPLFFDCSYFSVNPFSFDGPPAYEGDVVCGGEMKRVCVNRHNGTINGLFLDYSVRKVGLKELWTLKWSRKYDTCGPWTKCGGVQPMDWPEWMKNFKDY